jgi:hypothetical protein
MVILLETHDCSLLSQHQFLNTIWIFNGFFRRIYEITILTIWLKFFSKGCNWGFILRKLFVIFYWKMSDRGTSGVICSTDAAKTFPCCLKTYVNVRYGSYFEKFMEERFFSFFMQCQVDCKALTCCLNSSRTLIIS